MKTIGEFVKHHPLAIALFVVVAGGGGWWYFGSANREEKVESVLVERGTVSQVVSVTGIVRPASEVKLSFEKGGRIAAVYHNVGERVYSGTSLVSLESSELSAQLQQATAAVRVQEARLEELKRGTRPEDILVSEVDVKNARNDVLNDLKNAYVNADDAMRNKVDQLFSNPKSTTPQFNYSVSDAQLEIDLESGRLSMESILNAWSSSISNITAGDLYPDIASGKNNIRTVQNYLDKIALAVNSLTPNSSLSQTTIDAHKAAILAGRSNVTGALDSLTASEEKLRTAESKLALKKAGTIQEQIDAQAAEVDAARASVLQIEAQIGKTVIRSPIAGIITVQNAKRGEIAAAGSAQVSVISDSKYEIEANVPEADIAKIKIGNSAQVTLDAYGSDVLFGATVTKIDPAETIIDGVATYKTTLQFKKNDARIKSGMTANTDIYGARRENVLFVPGRVIVQKDGRKTVTIIKDGVAQDVEIVTGIRGSDGNVEVISGVEEGDKLQTN